MAAALSQSDEQLRKGSPLATFVNAMTSDQFVGITPGQALQKVIQNMADSSFSDTKPPATDANTWLNEMKDAVAKNLNVAATNLEASVQTDLSSLSQNLNSKNTTESVYEQAIKEIASSKFLAGLTPDRISAIKAAATTLALNDKLNRADSQKANAIIGAARKTVALLERPADIGCSMSILSWTETDHAFGHLIANEYIVVQVVVRNMNRDREFVLHDVEFEVNADPTGRFSRFFSGRDKVIVRALSGAQSSFDPRNITVHAAMGIGQAMAAVAPLTLPGEALTYASGVYNGAIVPALDKYWKDLSIDQLNLLNDVGFSSTSSSQTVVPKSGTTMFVTFIPAKPFEEGWWTQSCVEMQYLGSTNENNQVINLSRSLYDGADPAKVVSTSNANTSPDDETDAAKVANASKVGASLGVDVARALEACIADKKLLARSKRNPWTLGLHKSADGGLLQIPANMLDATTPCPKGTDGKAPPNCTSYPKANQDLFRNAYRVPYKKWPPNSAAIFRELANTVVSGMHILDETELQAVVSDLKCPTDDLGNLKLPDDGETLSCSVSGKNLDKLAKLRLHNPKSATDLRTAEGPVQVVGDANNATLTLTVADLRRLPEQLYNVYGVTSNGAEVETPQVIHLDGRPIITGFDPPTLDFSAGPDTLPLAILGFHLGSVKNVTISSGSSKTVKPGTFTADDLKITVVVTKADATSLAPKGDLTVDLLDAQGKSIVPASTKKLSFVPPPSAH
ncbi:MAG: hypothetical protein JST61_02940 [Acidobacteria bacterium]|nr:hypothetical protein [Acidobacteriota bacterium]